MTYKITKAGNTGIIEPLPDEILKETLIKNLSYEKQNSQFIPNWNWRFVRLYKDKKGEFPIGLLPLVEKIFIRLNLEYTIKQDIYAILNKDIWYNKLRPYQEKIVKEVLANNNHCIISAAVGSGKTIISKEIIETMGVKTLITVPTIEISKQWSEELKDIDYIVICTYQKVIAMLKKDRNKTKLWLKIFGLYISDECHLASINSVYKIATLTDNAKVIGLSGTPFRADGNTLKMNAALGYSIKESVRIRDLIKWGYLCDYEVKEYDVEGVDTKYKTYHEVYDDQITNNNDRNKYIAELAINSAKPVIIFIDKIDHGNNLLELLDKDKTVFFNGQLKKKERNLEFQNIVDGKYDYVISTKVLNEGVNIHNLKTLIFAGTGKSSIRIIQQLGRVLRMCDGKDKATVIHFKDKCKWFRNHYKERVEVFNWEK